MRHAQRPRRCQTVNQRATDQYRTCTQCQRLDKIRAARGSWRVSEGALLAWAFLGGTIGAYVGRALFRHKTRKQPFSSHLHQTAILQGFAVALVGGWMLAG